MPDTCKTCGTKLIKRETRKKPSQLNQPYYYTAYLYCPRCHKLYHSEKFKVINEQLNLIDASPVQASRDYDVEIWTDGACVFNGQANARAAWAFVTVDTERSGLVVGKQTNNVAEALAIYNALQWACERGFKRIKIYSDSQISINNIRKDPQKIKQNAHIFGDISELIQTYSLDVHFEKVVGHSGDINNERADSLANSLASTK